MELIIDNLKINYVDSAQDSDNPAVVILQGWGTSLEVYASMSQCIEEKYRVIRLDFPGFGKSTEPKVPWNVDAYADFFIKFMGALNIQKATLIGHSYGARVIIKLAARDSIPFEITNIVLVDGAGIMAQKTPEQKRKIARYKALKKVVDNPITRSVASNMVESWKNKQGSEDYRNATPIMRQCLVMAVNEDLTELLPKVRQEVLLIWGDRDTATPLSDGQLMEKLMPNAGLAVIPGTGHFSFAENPVLFRNIMRSYFKMEDK